MMPSFMRVLFMFVFHQSKCVSAIKRILFFYRDVCTLVFFHILVVCSLLLRLMLKSSVLRVGVKTICNIMEFEGALDQRFSIHFEARTSSGMKYRFFTPCTISCIVFCIIIADINSRKSPQNKKVNGLAEKFSPQEVPSRIPWGTPNCEPLL